LAASASAAAKPALVGHRGQRDAICPQQVRDLMGDRPPARGRVLGPPIGGQVGDDGVEVVAFRT